MRRSSSTLIFAVLVAASTAHAVPCPSDLPVLFIVQDKSGTMAKPPDPACTTCPSKMDSSKVAVSRLATEFSGRFRFGLELYPQASTTFNCTTGTTVSPVPSTANEIVAAYEAIAAGGGTPTAVSLDAARNALNSLWLPYSEPAYVLLITDGLPNCNLSLNPAACAASTPGCANNSCGLGAKDCLDDARTDAAAAQLLADGYKVYVVGFGTSTSYNDQAILDGIAAAGGTGSAYTASDEAGLRAALNAIGFDATTCCEDACLYGASECTALGEAKSCVLGADGCTQWQVDSCPPESACVGGVCESCTNECVPGDGRCVAESAQQCQVNAAGCAVWAEVAQCVWGEICSAGACVSCDECASNATRCSTTSEEEVCELDWWTGCNVWSTRPCAAGTSCADGACQSCSQSCTGGTARCTGEVPESCVADKYGCTRWVAGAPCATFCSGGACGSCGTSCSAGANRCNGATVEACAVDVNGCTSWSGTTTCGPGEFCTQGSCASCGTSCPSGSRRCAAGGVDECQAQPSGCTAWVRVAACSAGDTCVDGVCTAPCQDECQVGSARCDNQGRPVQCAAGPAGCAVLKAAPACALTALCVDGDCRERCAGGETESCPAGTVCTGLPQGRACMPDPSGPNEVGNPAKAGNGSDTFVATGCGCGAAGALPLAPLAGLAALLFRSRRRR